MAVFRVEKTKDFTVMSNHHLRNGKLSLKAKGLLSLMLSLPEDWDYTTKGLACICKDGVDSIGSALKELEQHGYLTRRRIRFENGRLGDIEYMIHEKPVSGEPEGDPPERENPEQVKPIQAKPKQGEPGQGKPAQLNTDPLNTDRLNTHQSIYPAGPEAAGCHEGIDGMDKMGLAEVYREIICENIEYGILAERHGKQRMDETVELMLEVVLSKRPYIRIAGDDFPREVVRSRFLKINSSHVEYVFGCIDRNTTSHIGNTTMAQASIGAGEAEIIENLGFATSLVFLILSVILSLIILVCGFFIIYTVYFRFLKIMVIVPLAAIAFSTLAGNRTVSSTCVRYFKYFLSIVMEAVTMALAIIICNAFISAGLPSFTGGYADWAQVLIYLCEITFTIALTVGACKGAQSLTGRALGL